MREAHRGQQQRGPPDDQPATGLRRAGTAQQRDRPEHQQRRQRQRDPAQPGAQHLGQPPAGGPGTVPPQPDCEHDPGAEHGQAGPVPAVGLVQVAGGGGLPAQGAGHSPGRMRDQHPYPGHRPEDAPQGGADRPRL
jgi:hypothetical protein